jgi:N-acetylglucosaminyldiphosphoundecaprenol N-acetyl-beta-D-mannosaminyltransferase
MGMPIDRITGAGAVAAVRDGLRGGRGGWIVTPNLDQLRLFDRDPGLGELFSSADVIVADGMPLIWASRLQGTPLPERVAGSDLVWSLAALAAEEKIGLFLLGGDPGVADIAAKELCRLHPGLRIAGTHCPPFGFEKDPGALAEIRAVVASSGAGLVYVGLGFPKQELLIAKLAPECPAAWFIGCGISLSFIAGDVQRAPGWMQATGLEWLHRLTQEPGRLAKRYLIHGLPFALKLLAATLRRRLRRGGR